MKCKAKVTAVSAVMAECYKCGAKIKLSKCPLHRTALIVVETKSGAQHRDTVFDKELEAIIESVAGSSVTEKLLMAPNVKLSINSKDVAFSAQLM